MKKTIFILALLVAITATAQKKYYPSMSFLFDNNIGGFAAIGNTCGNNDIVISHDSVVGNMVVAVNKVCNQWSYVQQWMSSPYIPSIVFKKRYLEMRIKSSAIHDDSCNIKIVFIMGGATETLNYTIDKANSWETKFFKVAGSADTVSYQLIYNFANGIYDIDYIYMGDAAIPPVPTINQVNDTAFNDDGSIYTIPLSGIEIPGRMFDGLKIKAEAKTGLFFQNVSLVKISGDSVINESKKTATLQFSLKQGVPFKSDSIIITLNDTIRGTSKRTGFKVTNSACSGNCFDASLKENRLNIWVFPSLIKNEVTFESPEPFSGDIQVLDITGKILLSNKIYFSCLFKLYLEGLESGIYFIKVSDRQSTIVKKIRKE